MFSYFEYWGCGGRVVKLSRPIATSPQPLGCGFESRVEQLPDTDRWSVGFLHVFGFPPPTNLVRSYVALTFNGTLN